MLIAGVAALTIATASVPARAQWIVFDPTNYAQNILTAARELQQVNNEIQMLENQATSLINQARNLASLPYSSLAQLEQSIAQTQQLLTQAQRIAYSVEHDRPGVHAAISAGLFERRPHRSSFSPTRSHAGRTRCAGFQDAMRVQAGVVQNLDSTRTQIDALVTASQGATGALQAAQSGNQLVALQTKQLADLTAVMASIARAQSLDAARDARDPGAGASADAELPQLRRRLSARHRADVPLMRGRLLNLPAVARAVGFALVAVAIVAATLHFREAHRACADQAAQSRGQRPIRSRTN